MLISAHLSGDSLVAVYLGTDKQHCLQKSTVFELHERAKWAYAVENCPIPDSVYMFPPACAGNVAFDQNLVNKMAND